MGGTMGGNAFVPIATEQFLLHFEKISTFGSNSVFLIGKALSYGQQELLAFDAKYRVGNCCWQRRFFETLVQVFAVV